LLAQAYKKQLLTYRGLAGKRLGLLINFHVALIKGGITRIVPSHQRRNAAAGRARPRACWIANVDGEEFEETRAACFPAPVIRAGRCSSVEGAAGTSAVAREFIVTVQNRTGSAAVRAPASDQRMFRQPTTGGEDLRFEPVGGLPSTVV